MPTTAEEVFAEALRTLSPSERLRLAALILDGLSEANLVIVDDSDTWSDQDKGELTAFSLQYAASLYPEEEDGV